MNRILVLSYAEQVAFDNYEQELLDQGYPADVAAQYAWDVYFASRKGLKVLA